MSSSSQPSALPAFSLNIAPLRSYILRLPLFTRAVLLIIVALWLLELQSVWDVVQWGALIPDEISIATCTTPLNNAVEWDGWANRVWIVYRTNTYPVIHNGFFHMLLNAIALTPLLERFEAEHGTLTALLLFVGRMLFGFAAMHRDLGC